MATAQRSEVPPCRRIKYYAPYGRMAKLVDALDLGSSGETRQSSNLCTPTKFQLF